MGWPAAQASPTWPSLDFQLRWSLSFSPWEGSAPPQPPPGSNSHITEHLHRRAVDRVAAVCDLGADDVVTLAAGDGEEGVGAVGPVVEYRQGACPCDREQRQGRRHHQTEPPGGGHQLNWSRRLRD